MKHFFLNQEFFSGKVNLPQEESFYKIDKTSFSQPPFDKSLFEAYPSVWTQAYSFERELTNNTDYQTALEEWMCLFLLHFNGIVFLRTADETKVQDEQGDYNLWTILRRTYPLNEELKEVSLLETIDGKVIGAYYPQTIFFPSRGRETWQESKVIQPYLESQRLSWKKCEKLFENANSNRLKQRSHYHLRAIRKLLGHNEKLQARIDEFCAQHFSPITDIERQNLPILKPRPSEWELEGAPPPSNQNHLLLKAYPLRQVVELSGSEAGKQATIYYLINEMPVASEWMHEPVIRGYPTAAGYVQTAENIISVRVGTEIRKCRIEEHDQIVKLNELFLTAPLFGKFGAADSGFTTQCLNIHREKFENKQINDEETTISLSPISKEFLKHFPEILKDPSDTVKVQWNEKAKKLQWIFNLKGKTVVWECEPEFQDKMVNTTVEMYPPKVSPEWHLYTLYGTTVQGNRGTWQLIDQNGSFGKNFRMTDENYISILAPDSETGGKLPNEPRAICYQGENGKEGGVLFFKPFLNHYIPPSAQATLSVDLGTSNTCLAVKMSTGESRVLTFSLRALTLWGIPPDPKDHYETPGSVPFNWGGEKGFFTTSLIWRTEDSTLEQLDPRDIRLEHLFRVDIPSLHKGLNDELLKGVFISSNEQNPKAPWRLRPDLKWGDNSEMKWGSEILRSLFLDLLLFYAHAEAFFNNNVRIGEYAFTYPLAFNNRQFESYKASIESEIRRIRHYCFGGDMAQNITLALVDESTAIANTIPGGNGYEGLLQVFVDIGGGTADIAIRHRNVFHLLDSLKIAGNNLFKILEKALLRKLSGFERLEKKLNILMSTPRSSEINIQRLLETDLPKLNNLPFGNAYSIKINDFTKEDFTKKEASVFAVIQSGTANDPLYSAYRAELFFQHLLAYALLQACATVISKKITLNTGIDIILGGNGWGLLMFAQWERSNQALKRKAERILEFLKDVLLPLVKPNEKKLLKNLKLNSINLLNVEDLSKAKTSVALGALRGQSSEKPDQLPPFAGLNVEGFSINGFEPQKVFWSERWSLDNIMQIFGKEISAINNPQFKHPQDLGEPYDPILKIFTGLGNSQSLGEDRAPAQIWQYINQKLFEAINQLGIEPGTNRLVKTESGENVSAVPSNYFLSHVLYGNESEQNILDLLAEHYGYYRKNGNGN
ncbi:MAG: hypothetical protein LUM44_06305 [Pyrinomonadaceae bacterium]|nr:hypothetical protein [Pyrinomonadaceae bacterium]